MSLTIRVLGPHDEAMLTHVAAEVFDNPTDVSLTREFLNDPRHHIAVAIDDDGVVVGFASGVHYVHPDKAAELWINEVGVAPIHRNQGVAKQLLYALLDHAARLGCCEAWVLTDRTNLAAMKLYGSVGGTERGQDQVMFSFGLNNAGSVGAA